jgi:hypothetical protein
MSAVIPYASAYDTLCAINDAMQAWQEATLAGRKAEAALLSREHDRLYDAYQRALFTPLPPLERRFVPTPIIVPPLNEQAPYWHERSGAREAHWAALAAIQFGYRVAVKP